MNVRLFRPCVGSEELESIGEAVGRSWLGLGPKVAEFELAWSQYLGAKSSIGVNSGTAALHLAVGAFGFPEGAKVLVPAMTFVATPNAALYNRLQPVFVDVDPETLQLDLGDLERKTTADCVAVIPVHFGGHPVQMDALMEFARARNLKVIEDCAHAAGGEYLGRKLGLWGDIGCFSFEEKKQMTTGDGGMLSSDDAELIAPAKHRRWVGIDKDTWSRELEKRPDSRHWYYEVAEVGYKYNMNDLMASIGLIQLRKLPAMNARRRQIIQRYLAGLEGAEHIRPLLPYNLNSGAEYWIFGLRTPRRDELIEKLNARSIGNGVHYLPMTLQPLFAEHRGTAPVAEQLWEEMITLPLHASLTDAEVDYVLDAILDFDRDLGR